MRGLFLLFLFTQTTILIESPHCIADEGYYEQLRKKKSLKPGDSDSIRKQTLDEQRRSQVNQISAKSKADAEEVKKLPDTVAGEPTTDRDIDDSEKEHPTQPSLKPTTKSGRKSADKGNHSKGDSADVKVNPGNLDELEFPGE